MIRDRMSTLLKELRESPRAEGRERIYTHGEKEWESMERLKRDGIPVQEKTLQELRKIASGLSIDADRHLDIQS